MRYVKGILITLILLIVSLTTIVLLLWYNLDWIAHPDVLAATQKRWAPKAKVEWDKIDIEVTNQGFFNKTLNLSIDESTCIKWSATEICIEKLALVVPVQLAPQFNYKIEKLVLISNRSHIALYEFASGKQESTPLNFNSLLLTYKSYLKQILNLRPEDFKIEISNSVLDSKESQQKIDFSIDKKQVSLNFKQETMQVALSGDLSTLSKNELALKLKTDVKTESWLLNTQVNLTAKTSGENKIDILAIDKSKDEGIPSFNRVETSLDLKISEDGSRLAIDTFDLKPDYGFDRLIGKACVVQFYSRDEESTTWNCQNLRVSRFDSQQIRNLKKEFKAVEDMLSDLNVKLKGYLNEKNLSSKEKAKLAEVSLSAESVKKGFMTLDLATQAEFFQSEKKLSWNINNLDTNIKINSFQEVVKRLKGSRWAIPMPLNTLDGTIKIDVEKITSMTSSTEVQGQARILLKGKGQQKVDLTMNGTYTHSMDTDKRPHNLKAVIEIGKVSFHLPPFDPLKGIPSVARDSRISTESNKKPKEEKSTFDYNIKIESKSKDSIQVFYKHFEPYLTASLKGELTPNQSQFSVKIEDPFKISYLRREVTIVNFVLENNQIAKDKIDIDGRIRYEASGYIVFIDVLGDIGSPRVKLSSQPSLSRDDIISLLLYKRTRSDLTQAQQQNVGGANAALTDRAIGLIGIWAFASTPVESVYYDSQTQSYQAVIGLPGEVNLSLGTDWENSRFVGLRKRLSDRWFLVTGYESGDEQGVGNIFLQREYTY